MTNAELSDGRFVELKLSFVSGVLLVTAYYYDPLQESIRVQIENEFAEAGQLERQVVRHLPPTATQKWVSSIGRTLHSWFSGFESLWPLGIATAVAALIAFAFFFRSTPPIQEPQSVAKLLTHGRQLEDAKIVGGGAIHSTYSFETLSQDGKLLDAKTVDAWRSMKPHRSALRLLDSTGKVVAGRWDNASGKNTTYAQPGGLRAAPEEGSSTVDFDLAWQMAPGGDAPSVLTEFATASTIQRDGNGYEIAYERPEAITKPGIVSATLVLDPAGFQPIREAIRLHFNGNTREYRFRQLTYEVVPADRVIESDFAPSEELSALRPRINPSEGSENGPRLMLTALQLLNDLGPDVEQMIEVERLPEGAVEISGVLPTESQKTSIERVFRSLGASSQLRLALHSREEPAKPFFQPSPPGHVESFEEVAAAADSPFPLESDLRSALLSRGVAAQDADARARQLASAAIGDGSAIQREAWTLHQLATGNFSAHELTLMSGLDRLVWLDLFHKHLVAINQHLSSLDVKLKPLLRDASTTMPGAEIDVPEPDDASAVARMTETLNHDAERLNGLLQAQLSVSASAPPQPSHPSEIAELLAKIRSQTETLRTSIERVAQIGRAEPR